MPKFGLHLTQLCLSVHHRRVSLKENPLRLREKQVVESFRSEIATVENAIAETLNRAAELPHDVSMDGANAIIQEITEVIWDAKTRRQLIFASHNANIVVNGDAELVVHCAYREDRDRTKGHIAAEGAIDRRKIRDAIEQVIEGGEEAFELRRQKYGF